VNGVPVSLILCGAPLTTRAPHLVSVLQADGWYPTVICTPSASAWFDHNAVTELTGQAPVSDFRSPMEPRRGVPPAAMVVCPATFNTVNKAASGIADTYASATVCEALATGIPLVMVPMVSTRLWGHPAWVRNLDVLRDAGVVLIDVRTGGLDLTPAPSGSGDEVVARFDPQWIVTQLAQLVPR
jgi:phosphopantothenoylcysteine decarboxylase